MSRFLLSNEEPRYAKNIRITLDPRRDGRVNLVIHELLHVYMAIRYNMVKELTYELEEPAILAWERTLSNYLHHEKRAHQLELWDRAIRRKLAQ